MIQMTRKEQLGAIVLAGMLIMGLALRIVLTPKPAPLITEPPREEAAEKELKKKEIMVHVAGAVRAPGVYTLREGARVFEALEAAGGALAEADAHALNLAEPLFDGRRLHVPYAGESLADTSGASGKKVNINTALADELVTLPGIGPAKAAAIVSFREKNGPFGTLEDLAQVSGIGPKTVETLKDHITLY